MPIAGGSIAAPAKYAYLDHDGVYVATTPPVQNTWYTIFEAEDVRLLWFIVNQSNGEAAAKEVEVKWTIDGNVYEAAATLDDITDYYVYKDKWRSTAGNTGLVISVTEYMAAYYTDKRGHNIKAEVRLTDAPGAGQAITGVAVYETLEVT